MTLDERLRDELRRAVEAGPLREHDALDNLWVTHRRGLVRARVTRQALATVVVVSLFASVALVVSWRNNPDRAGVAAGSGRFRSTVTIRVATPSGVKELALAPSTRRAALIAAHLSQDSSKVYFSATFNPARDFLALRVTAPTRYASEIVTRRWAAALIKARRAEAVRLLQAKNRTLNRKVSMLLDQLRNVNAELVRIDPATYKGYDLSFHIPSSRPFTEKQPPLPPVPEAGSVHELNLANERVQILSQLAHLGAQAASSRIFILGPYVSATVISQTPAVRVHTSSPSRTAPVLISWAVGLLVALAGAVFVYRRRTRATRQVAAYSR